MPVEVASARRRLVRRGKDVLDVFRDQGRGYETRINAVLRAFLEHETGRKR